MLIGLSQRVDQISHYDEVRDNLDQAWHKLLIEIGLLPCPLPNIDIKSARDLLNQVKLDGLILTGGNSLASLDPSDASVNLKRDTFEEFLITHALHNKIPILGVCRGAQMINNYFGGKFIKVKGHIAQTHSLTLTESQVLDLRLPKNFEVNSFHSWSIPSNGLAGELKAFAVDHNGNIEGFYAPKDCIMGIMWHPERPCPSSQDTKRLIQNFFKNYKHGTK